MSAKRVLSLGQCAADHAAIAGLLRTRFQTEVIPAATPEEALAELRGGEIDLVLVNRILDWTGAPGLDFIRQVKADPELRRLPVMLVSNYEDSQRDAVAAGALPGFGKSALGRAETDARLRAILDVGTVAQDNWA